MSQFVRLTEQDRPEITAHLLRLDPEARRRRFGSALKDSAVVAYVDRIDLSQGTLLGLRAEGGLRALAELFADPSGAVAEAAFSVEQDWRGRGLGTALLDAALARAGELGQQRVVLYIQPGNQAMKRVAHKHAFDLHLDEGELVAERALQPIAA